MRVIIAGSRDAKINSVDLNRIIHSTDFNVTEVFSGCSGNVDHLGEEWAESRNIPVVYFPADWNVYGRKAGPIRNRTMAEHADALVAVWDGKSRGTLNMIEEAQKRNIPVHIHRYGDDQ